MTFYLTDDAFSVKAKRFNKMFTGILDLFFLLRIANKSHFYALSCSLFSLWKQTSDALIQTLKAQSNLVSELHAEDFAFVIP